MSAVRPPGLRARIEQLEARSQLDPVIAQARKAFGPLLRSPLAPVLRGEGFGHAVHPLLTDFPLGCWASAGLLDLLGGRAARPAAQRLVGLGVLLSLPTAASGAADWSPSEDRRVQRVGLVHAVGNTGVALAYLTSWRLRRRGSHAAGVAVGMVGAGAAWVTGYLGGHLSLVLQSGTGARWGSAAVGDVPPAGGDGWTPDDDPLGIVPATDVLG